MMTPGQQQALLALLQDSDDHTLVLLKRELVDAGGDRLEDYEQLLQGCGDVASRHLRDVIGRIREARHLGDISRQLAEMETWDEMLTFCWELTRAEDPELKDGPYRRQLEQWGQEVADRLGGMAKLKQDKTQVEALREVLALRHGLTGNEADYYHPRNCYLPWVMEFRRGIPLTLCLIYLLVGRRAGVEVEGISAPGHFLARVGKVYFDPFYEGRLLTQGEWDRIRAEVPAQHQSMLDSPCPPQQMAHRLLLNLRNAYVKRQDGPRRERIDHYLAVLQH